MPHAARIKIAASLLLATICGASSVAFAQATPDIENGRYSLKQQPDGSYLRLDTRSGTLATCSNSLIGWECRVTPDERVALDAEIGRLQAENESLRGKLALGKNDDVLPKSDSLSPSMPRSADGSRKIEIPLPSDRDVDRVMGFFEQVWRRLVEMAGRIQRDSGGKI